MHTPEANALQIPRLEGLTPRLTPPGLTPRTPLAPRVITGRDGRPSRSQPTAAGATPLGKAVAPLATSGPSGVGPATLTPRVLTRRDNRGEDAEDGGGGFLNTLGKVFEAASTSPFGDIPFVPDFIEDTLLSPIGIASLLLAPVTGGGSLVGRAGLTAAARVGAKPLARELGRRAVGETIFTGGATLGANIIGDALPEDTPGGLRTALLLSSGAVGGFATLKAARSAPLATLARTSGLSAAEQARYVSGEFDTRAFLSGRQDSLSEETVEVAEAFLRREAKADTSLAFQDTFVKMLASGDELGQRSFNDGPVLATLKRLPVLGKAARFSHPASHLDKPTQVGLIHKGSVEATWLGRYGDVLADMEKEFRDATGGLTQNKMMVSEGSSKVREDLVRYSAGGTPPPEAGYVRDIMLHPENYTFVNPRLKDSVTRLRKSVDNDLLFLKRARGADVTAREDFAGTQLWEQPQSQVDDILRERRGKIKGKTTAEYKRGLTLAQGLEAGLTPQRQTFLDVYRHGYVEEVATFATFEGRRAARIAGGVDGGVAVKLSKAGRKEIAREIKTLNKDRTGSRSRVVSALNGVTGKAGEAKQGIRTAEAQAQTAAANVAASQSRAAGMVDLLHQRQETFTTVRTQVEALLRKTSFQKQATGVRGNKAFTAQRRGLLSGVKELRNDMRVMRDVTKMKELERAERQLNGLVQKMDKGRLKARDEATLKNLLNQFDELPNARAMEDAARKVEEAMDASARITDFTKFIKRNIKLKATTVEPFPEHLVPVGLKVDRLRKAYNAHAESVAGLGLARAKAAQHKSAFNPANQAATDIIDKAYDDRLKALTGSSDVLAFGGQVSDSVRGMVLTADASVLSIQYLAAAMDNPLRAASNLYHAVKFTLSPEGFRTFLATNNSGLADARLHGLNIVDHSPTQLSAVTPGARKNLIDRIPFAGPGLLKINDAVYGRGIAYLKYQVYQSNVEMLTASKNQQGFGAFFSKVTGRKAGADLSDAEIKREVAEYTNNLLGGQNMEALGIGRNQQALEKMVILTPDYLRSTSGMVASLTDLGVKGALARRTLGLYFGLAAVATATVTTLFSDQMPNLFDPTSPKWLTMQVDREDGGTTNLNPFSRFVSLAKIPLKTIGVLAEEGKLDDALNAGYEQSQRFLRGRLASMPGIGAEVLSNKDYFGNPIVTEGGLKGQLQQVEHVASSALPIVAQSLREEGEVSLTTAVEFLGVSAYSTTPQEKMVTEALTAAALNAGVPEDLVLEAVRKGRNPLTATIDGVRVLSAVENRDAVEYAVSISGVEEDVVRRKGRDQRILSLDQQNAVDEGLRQSFFDGQDAIDTLYSDALVQVAEAVAAGQTDYNGVRLAIGNFRAQKRAMHTFSSDENGPFRDVIAELNNPDKDYIEHADNVLRRQFFDAVYDDGFTSIGPNGVEFDFRAQQQALATQRLLLGDAKVEQFMSQGDTKLHPLEREMREEQALLEPYWRLGDDIWARIGGLSLAPSAQDVAEQQPNHPLLLSYNRQLQDQRRVLRLQTPNIDRVLVKWYGRAPVLLGRR